MEETNNIIRILEKTKDAMKKSDAVEIKSLSNQTTNTASRTHDPDNLMVAVIIYSIGKILERSHYKDMKGWDRFYKNTNLFIDKAISSLKKKNETGMRESLSNIRKEIENLSGKLKIYIKDVFRKAQINKASKIYEHGISMEKTSKLLGITMYDLASYAGQTNISETKIGKALDTKSRIKIAMEMFS
jgi:hypothetical protein